MTHRLGLKSTMAIDLDTKQKVYSEIEVSEEVIKWLDAHDKKMGKDGSTIFIVNKLKYVYLGPVLLERAVVLSTNLMGEA